MGLIELLNELLGILSGYKDKYLKEKAEREKLEAIIKEAEAKIREVLNAETSG